MKKVLFIDRDGTLIVEPPQDYQVDSLEKLEFYPMVFTFLRKIAEELDYILVMVTNQDGLGTTSFPEDTFWPAHNKMIKGLENEGIYFDEVHIDKSLPEDNAPTRKPGTAMLERCRRKDYDLEKSFVIGDRWSDIELAKNLGSKGILLNNSESNTGLDSYCKLNTNSWEEIYNFLRLERRVASLSRKTKETDIQIRLDLDGSGKAAINTGIAFFDHMLEQIARHGLLDLDIKVKGDLHVDEHHTIEDTAIALGEVFSIALSDKIGMERYGYIMPMDDCLAQLAIDFGGRSWIEWKAKFKREKIGEMPTEMFFHFFKSFSDGAKCNLNIIAKGKNEHHKIEAIFKAFAKAIKMAIRRDPKHLVLPTTKGLL